MLLLVMGISASWSLSVTSSLSPMVAMNPRSTEIPRVDLVPGDQSVQCWAANRQKPRPLGDVPARPGERLHQGVPLRPVPRLSERCEVQAVLGFDAEVPCLDEFGPCHEDRA